MGKMTEFGTKIDSLVSTDRLCNLIRFSQKCATLPGYIAELGVYGGGSLEILAKFNPGKDILAFDSFEGVPAPSQHDLHNEGDFGGLNARNIVGYFALVYPAVRIFKGFIPKVFEGLDGNTRFAFTHIDLDMYESIYAALDFIVPRTNEGGIILLDDYKVKSTPGCQKAIEEFFEAAKTQVQYRSELKYWDVENAPSHYQYLIVV